eukprot:TRINITY_DN9488_c0_g1_i4.p1 TRINITY_DN9488_c0_g1~~TRINITY_DN9488_c0_g1_i4.p1  ORF type:complete len:1119 (+),score=179.25 TRINITY_DN9488_c0_g1_i4:27-3383(+)
MIEACRSSSTMRLIQTAIWLCLAIVASGTSDDACNVCVCFDFFNDSIVDCTGANLVAIPRNIPNNATILNLRSNAFDLLPRASFAGLTSIQQLFLSNNGMTVVDDGAFAGLPSLRLVDLSSNQLMTLPSFAFDNPSALETIEIRANRLTVLDGSWFSGLRNLHKIDASRNRINRIASMNSLVELSTLLLNHNSIAHVNVGDLDLNTNLRTLELDYNRVSAIEPAALYGLTQLEILKLRSNQLWTLPSNVFERTTALVELDVSLNYLTTFPNQLVATMTQLARLNLANNELEALPDLQLLESIDIVRVGGNNRYDCCSIHWLRNTTLVQDLQDVTCHRPQMAKGKALMSIQGDVQVCTQEVPDSPTSVEAEQVQSRSLVIRFPMVHGNAEQPAAYYLESKTHSSSWATVECPSGRYPLGFGSSVREPSPCIYNQRHPSTLVLLDPLRLSVTNLVPFTNYTFRARAENSFGNSSLSSEVTVRTKPARPESVDAPTVVIDGARTITIQATMPREPNGIITKTIYSIWNSTRNYTTEITGSNLTATDLRPYTTYSITTQPFTVMGSGPSSPVLTYQTQQDSPDVAPTVHTTNTTSTTIGFAWHAVDLPEANGIITAYTIISTNLSSIQCSVPELSCIIANLAPGTTYAFVAQAATAAGMGPASAPLVLRTLDAVPDGLQSPTVGAVGSTTVELSWAAPSQPNGDIVKYEVNATTGNTSVLFTIPGDELTSILTPLRPASEYHLALRAYTSLGASAYTSVVIVTTLEDAPSALAIPAAAEVGSRTVNLQWAAPSAANGNLTKYTVYRVYLKRVQEHYPIIESSDRVAVAEFPPTATQGMVEDLDPGVLYHLVITASTAAGEADVSPSLVLQTKDDVPSRPGLPEIQVLSSSSAYVQWTQPGEARGNLTKYQIVLNGDRVAYETENVEPSSLNTTLTGLDDDKLYEVTVIAFSSAGPSVPSLEASLQTPKEDINITPIIIVVVIVLFVMVLSVGYSYERTNRLRNMALNDVKASMPMNNLPTVSVAEHPSFAFEKRDTTMEELDSGSSDEEQETAMDVPPPPQPQDTPRPPRPSLGGRVLPAPPTSLGNGVGINALAKGRQAPGQRLPGGMLPKTMPPLSTEEV